MEQKGEETYQYFLGLKEKDEEKLEELRFLIDNHYFEFKAKFERYGYCFYDGWHIRKQDNRDCI